MDALQYATDDLVPLEAVLCTEALQRRPARPPDYRAENRALVTLAQALADAPGTILQTLADTILAVLQADSAGVSLLTPHDGGKTFYWPAIAGAWHPHIGGGTPRDFGPCGDVLDRNIPLLFKQFERRYTYFQPVTPPTEECLLVPFYVAEKAVGTIWAITHNTRRQFDAEDQRQLVSLGRFASAAYQAQVSLNATAQLTAIIESSDDAIISHDLTGIIQSWNRGAERLFGYPAWEVIGQPITLLLPADRREEESAVLARLHRGEHIEPYDTVRRRKDGTYVDISLTVSPLTDIRCQIVGASQIARDITERKRSEAVLQDAYVLLEEHVAERTAALRQEIAERQRLESEVQRAEHFALLGRLAAGVSHEIRNPLSAIFLHVDLLEEETRTPAPDSAATVAETLTEIKTQLTRLDDLLQDYLSLARVATSERTAQDIGAAVQAWAQEWLQLPVPHKVMLRVEGLAHLGAVALHTSTFRRAMLNLVQNALDAMPDGGTLTLRGARTAMHVQLQVCDTGSGIPDTHLPHIFEPLYTTKQEGTGLGLYITQEIVAAHGGQLSVESVVGQGTIFTIRLPRAE